MNYSYSQPLILLYHNIAITEHCAVRRYWKSKLFKKTAEMVLLCKYWDHQKNRHTQRLDHEAARAKELSTKAVAKSGADGKTHRLENIQFILVQFSLARAHPNLCGRQKQRC